MAIKSFKVEKLIRNQLPSIMRAKGIVVHERVMHLHVHLIPRYQGDMEDPKGGVRGVIPSKQKY